MKATNELAYYSKYHDQVSRIFSLYRFTVTLSIGSPLCELGVVFAGENKYK